MDEKLRVLKLVADGTVTPEQAEQLLSALGADGEAEAVPAVPVEDYDRKMFRIVVDSADGDKVNVQFPVKGIKKIIKATGKLPINIEGMEGADLSGLMDAVVECLDCKTVGDFVTVNSADGDKVRIFVE